MRNVLAVLAVVSVLALIIVSFGSLVSTTESSVLQAVSDQGYTDPVVIDSHRVAASWYGCADSDSVAYEVSATNVNGKRVHLIACADTMFKGVTIRSPR